MKTRFAFAALAAFVMQAGPASADIEDIVHFERLPAGSGVIYFSASACSNYGNSGTVRVHLHDHVRPPARIAYVQYGTNEAPYRHDGQQYAQPQYGQPPNHTFIGSYGLSVPIISGQVVFQNGYRLPFTFTASNLNTASC